MFGYTVANECIFNKIIINTWSGDHNTYVNDVVVNFTRGHLNTYMFHTIHVHM